MQPDEINLYLLAQDNPIAAKVSIKTIEKLNVPKSQIFLAKDGQEAVDQLRKSLETGSPKLDLVLSMYNLHILPAEHELYDLASAAWIPNGFFLFRSGFAYATKGWF